MFRKLMDMIFIKRWTFKTYGISDPTDVWIHKRSRKRFNPFAKVSKDGVTKYKEIK